MTPTQAPAARVLFLDDDPARAAAFLADHPLAVWVRTVDECVECLREPWDEVHLDHDLNGEVLVELDRDDCGMAVVRHICGEDRPHLRPARFVVHSHNDDAACLMVLLLQATGYRAEARRFISPGDVLLAPWPCSRVKRAGLWLRRKGW